MTGVSYWRPEISDRPLELNRWSSTCPRLHAPGQRSARYPLNITHSGLNTEDLEVTLRKPRPRIMNRVF